jgi:hypothetical protein
MQVRFLRIDPIHTARLRLVCNLVPGLAGIYSSLLPIIVLGTLRSRLLLLLVASLNYML